MPIPDPNVRFPMEGFPQVVFLKNVITQPNIEVGDYTYYDDPDGAGNFERNVLYHFPFIGDWLRIGKFCALGRGAKFIMNGANHKMSGVSTYPFNIFGGDWAKVTPKMEELPYKGDTVIGNDVWLGYDCLIMPGVKIGHGAIVASRAVVTKDVPPYTIVGGNPAQSLRQRFSDEAVQALIEIAWWDWDVEKITRNLELIVGADWKALKGAE